MEVVFSAPGSGVVCWNHPQLNCGSATKFTECFNNICLSEHSQVLSRAWFVAVSKNEASGADKTKKPQRMSSFPQDQEEVGEAADSGMVLKGKSVHSRLLRTSEIRKHGCQPSWWCLLFKHFRSVSGF